MNYIGQDPTRYNMYLLGMLIREDRVNALLNKKEVEWTADEKAKESGGPIAFEDNDDEFLDLLLSDDEDEDEDEDCVDSTDDNSLPCIDFTYKPPTIQEKVQQRLDEYAHTLYHMEELSFVKLCIKEGILDENHIY